MPPASHFIQTGSQQLHYLQWGTGKELLLAFHGYGRNAANFDLFVPYLQQRYTIVSVDLPNHGSSAWADDAVLSRPQLKTLAHKLMADHGVRKLSLLGYSMGGRVCLALVELMPECIDKVTLLATDGLTVNNYYYFFTGTWLGKKMFSNMLQHPGKYFAFLRQMKKWKLVNESQYKFVMHYLESEQDRIHIARRWPALRMIIPSPAGLKRLIQKHGIQVTMFMGRFDRIMPPELAQKFRSGLSTVQLHILEKGHRIFDESNASDIAQSLL